MTRKSAETKTDLAEYKLRAEAIFAQQQKIALEEELRPPTPEEAAKYAVLNNLRKVNPGKFDAIFIDRWLDLLTNHKKNQQKGWSFFLGTSGTGKSSAVGSLINTLREKLADQNAPIYYTGLKTDITYATNAGVIKSEKERGRIDEEGYSYIAEVAGERRWLAQRYLPKGVIFEENVADAENFDNFGQVIQHLPRMGLESVKQLASSAEVTLCFLSSRPDFIFENVEGREQALKLIEKEMEKGLDSTAKEIINLEKKAGIIEVRSDPRQIIDSLVRQGNKATLIQQLESAIQVAINLKNLKILKGEWSKFSGYSDEDFAKYLRGDKINDHFGYYELLYFQKAFAYPRIASFVFSEDQLRHDPSKPGNDCRVDYRFNQPKKQLLRREFKELLDERDLRKELVRLSQLPGNRHLKRRLSDMGENFIL